MSFGMDYSLGFWSSFRPNYYDIMFSYPVNKSIVHYKKIRSSSDSKDSVIRVHCC